MRVLSCSTIATVTPRRCSTADVETLETTEMGRASALLSIRNLFARAE